MIIGSLPNTDQNNLIPATTDETYAVTAEALTETETGFSFTIHAGTSLTEGGVSDLSDSLIVIVGLMERSGTDGPWGFTTDDCALWVSWERGGFPYTGLPGTVTETWGSFTGVITPGRMVGGRNNVDVGFTRPGPRYTLGLSGANYVGWVDHDNSAIPRAIVSSPSTGFPFPLRLVMGISSLTGGTTPPAEIRDIFIEGRIGEKGTLTADNKTEWGVDSAHLHLRIYQVGVVNGFPVDIDL